MLKDASPSTSMMVLCTAATQAPIAAGRPKPIVYECEMSTKDTKKLH